MQTLALPVMSPRNRILSPRTMKARSFRESDVSLSSLLMRSCSPKSVLAPCSSSAPAPGLASASALGSSAPALVSRGSRGSAPNGSIQVAAPPKATQASANMHRSKQTSPVKVLHQSSFKRARRVPLESVATNDCGEICGNDLRSVNSFESDIVSCYAGLAGTLNTKKQGPCENSVPRNTSDGSSGSNKHKLRRKSSSNLTSGSSFRLSGLSLTESTRSPSSSNCDGDKQVLTSTPNVANLRRGGSRRRSSSIGTFRAHATCLPRGGSKRACIVVVDGHRSVFELNVPSPSAQCKTACLKLTGDNFWVNVNPGVPKSIIVTIACETELGDVKDQSFILVFCDSYCVTRFIFQLYCLRSCSVSLRGLTALASACVQGSTLAASADPRFCPTFFKLHQNEIDKHYPSRGRFLSSLSS